jgi:type IV secretory pathway VirB4 component
VFSQDNGASLFGTPPVLSDLHGELLTLIDEAPEAAASARVLADLIYPLALGREAQAWNCQTNLDLTGSPLVMFGLRDVADRMKAKRLKQIQLFTWNQYLRDKRRKIELVDECWWLMNGAVTAQDLAERAARLRKYNVGLVLATQKVSDFAANRHADKVLTQAETYLIFGQKVTDVDAAGELFKLTGPERQALTGARKGEFLLVTKNAHVFMQKHVAPDRAELYSTSPRKVKHALAG